MREPSSQQLQRPPDLALHHSVFQQPRSVRIPIPLRHGDLLRPRRRRRLDLEQHSAHFPSRDGAGVLHRHGQLWRNPVYVAIRGAVRASAIHISDRYATHIPGCCLRHGICDPDLPRDGEQTEGPVAGGETGKGP